MENNLLLGVGICKQRSRRNKTYILNDTIGNVEEHVSYLRLAEMDEIEVKLQSRFVLADIYRLKRHLRIPGEIRIEQRYAVKVM